MLSLLLRNYCVHCYVWLRGVRGLMGKYRKVQSWVEFSHYCQNLWFGRLDLWAACNWNIGFRGCSILQKWTEQLQTCWWHKFVHSENGSRSCLLVTTVRRSWTLRIAAPYRSHVEVTLAVGLPGSAVILIQSSQNSHSFCTGLGVNLGLSLKGILCILTWLTWDLKLRSMYTVSQKKDIPPDHQR